MKRWPLNDVFFWETAPFFRLLLPLIVGVGCYSCLPSLPIIPVVAISGVAFVIFTALLFVKQKHLFTKVLDFLSLNIAVCALAYIACYGNDIKNNENWFGHTINKADAYVARITDTPAEKERTWKLKVQLIGALAGNTVRPVTGNAFVYVFKDQQAFPYKDGDTILLPPQWQPIKNAGNPHGFDYATYGNRNNLYHLQFTATKDITLIGNSNELPLVKRVHNWCMQTLAAYIKDKPTLGLMQAMLIGDEANLDPDLRQSYSETGIIHVVAISGSHIAMFFVIIAFLLGWIKHKKYHWVKYLVALPLVWFYVFMAGAPPSAIRSAIMFSILAFGFFIGRNGNTLNMLLATAFILLLAEPMWLFAVGFQLSFLAVLSLILFYRPVYKWFSPANTVVRTLWSAIAASLAAEILVAPLVIYYFYLFPAMFIFANLVAFMLMGIVLVSGILLLLFSAIAPVANIIAATIVFIATGFDKVILLFQQLNPLSFRFIGIEEVELILIYFAITAFAVFIFKKYKQALFLGLFSICVVLASLCYNEWQALNQHKLVVYNVNHANHIELIAAKKYYSLRTGDSIGRATDNYILKPAHTAWHSWQQGKREREDVFVVGGKRILILDEAPSATGSFPVDYLVINFPLRKADISMLLNCFSS